MRSDDLYSRPADIPIPEDDGASAHLPGLTIPSVSLKATSGDWVDLSTRGTPWLVVYAYPRTGLPNSEPAGGVAAWNAIPGARGCTPQSCSYRDHHQELAELGAEVFGLSTQTTEYQREAVDRLHLPFPLLSDSHLRLAGPLRLPVFLHHATKLLCRLTLVARRGRIEAVHYPVFPPEEDAQWVAGWLRDRYRSISEPS